ncbi:AAA family ATPase [Starkeya sp. ORNL1]|uniref:YhaN family protein n=1 Tax=Starkeya sp. ORNL1 TaxID=2709380 RepID=UPI001462D3E7|nr:YhaN family protein [Starkeya sp. ORNL1]QJP13347.1 AAA family ATPase [Starkeya sp. ORNL1]
MRFHSLGLDRYGRFTDRVLEFDPNSRVTIVQGANEAGKTTALAAVTDALYGIELRSRFDFLHASKDMRISARIAAVDGRGLAFARLKRRTATLVDLETGAPLNDDCLAPFLGAHDRRAFLDIFGLDQARLRAGGRSLLAGGGDLAEALVAAAPGLGQVARLRDDFQARAAKTFNPDRRTASHEFYVAMERRKAAHALVSEQEVRVTEVRRLREEAEAAAAARGHAVGAETDAGLAADRARALGRAARELRTLDIQLAARAALGDVPSMPAGFVARARDLLAAIEKARAAVATADGEHAAAEAALNAIALDDEILGLAEAIESSDEARAAVQAELRSLPNRRNEATEARGALVRIATGLGLADVETLRQRLPGAPLLARADALVDRLAAVEVRSATLADAERNLAARRTELEQGRGADAPVEDPASLRRRLAALDGAEARERALRSLDHRLAASRTDLAERATRLAIGIADADALAVRPLPLLAAAEAGLRHTRETAEAVTRQGQAHADLVEQLAQLETRLAAINAGRPAPTDAAIETARRERDALWGAVRPLVLLERGPAEGDRAAALGLDRALGAADLLADERLRETERLADLASAERDIATLKIRIDAAQLRLTEADARHEGSSAAWRELWAASRLAPPADESAIALLREAETIRVARETARKEAAEAAGQREETRREREDYARLRADLGLPVAGEAPMRMAELRDALGEREARFQQARDRERDLGGLGKQQADLANRSAEIARERHAVAEEAATVFPLLAIRTGAPVEEARAALGLWREALTFDEKLGTAEHRVAGIERDEANFIARVRDAQQRAGLAAEGDAFEAVRHLRSRLDAARQARSRADAAATALETRRAALEQARAALERGEAALAILVEPLPAAAREPLPPLLDRLEQAVTIDARLKEIGERLADLRGSRSEADIRADIADRDDEALARLAAEADAAHAAARQARDLAVERDTKAQTALKALDQREGAAAAAQDEQDALAEIAGAVERFTRDHVAARLLGAAIERYRQQHQNPIVERASHAFAALTGGRWEGIGIDYDQDPPRLAALRDGQLLGVEALSEGTADQLFLALRIAAIEEHARRATPLPFIADDLFVTFDEPRTEAALRLLAELGAVTQVIVFTHHEHVVEWGTRALGDGVGVIRL